MLKTITQSTNVPIVITCRKELDVQDMQIILYHTEPDGDPSVLRVWSKDDVIIEDRTITIPMTQADTNALPITALTLEIKILDSEGYVAFTDDISFKVKRRINHTVLGDDEIKWLVPIDKCVDIGVVDVNCEKIIKQGYSPFVDDETGTWWQYNDKTKQFEDTGISAGVNEEELRKIFATKDEVELLHTWGTLGT